MCACDTNNNQPESGRKACEFEVKFFFTALERECHRTLRRRDGRGRALPVDWGNGSDPPHQNPMLQEGSDFLCKPMILIPIILDEERVHGFAAEHHGLDDVAVLLVGGRVPALEGLDVVEGDA